MTTTATVFDYEDFPSEIADYFDECVEMVTNGTGYFINFPLDWTIDDFALEYDNDNAIALTVVVTYLKANMVAGTELAIIN